MELKKKFKNKFGMWNEKRNIKNNQLFYENMLRDKDGKGTEVIFNVKSLSWIVVIVTIFLQLISLATTYKGSIVYFGGVELPFGISAPLLFALAVQLIVFCMSHTIKGNFKKGLIFILIMSTLCSIYFSYIGIYNNINSPINYLEERYKQIYGNITDQYETVKEDTKGNMKNSVLDIVNKLSTSLSSLTMEVEKNDKMSKNLANIKINTSQINPQGIKMKKPNIANYGNNLSKYYEDMEKYNSTIGDMVTDASKQESDLKKELYDNEVKSILGEKTQEEFRNESITKKTSKDQLEKGIESTYSLIVNKADNTTLDEKLTKIQEYCQNYIIGKEKNKDIFSTVLANLYSQALLLDGAKGMENFQEQINEFLIINNKDSILIKPLEDIKTKVYKESTGSQTKNENILLSETDSMTLYTTMQSEIKGAIYTLNQLRINGEQISSKDDKYLMHNLYVLPINNLVESNEGRAMAWFCLLFAILVDGLTLLFAIIEGKSKTPLFAKSNKDIVGKSKETMEELLLVSILSSDSKSKEEKRVENTLMRLENFIKPFKLITETMDNGYSMYCEITEIEEYQVFLATLCQFNLANIVKAKEIFFNKDLEEEDEKTYVLVKTKFIIWANEKIVALTLNNQYIESLQSIEGDFGAKGALL